MGRQAARYRHLTLADGTASATLAAPRNETAERLLGWSGEELRGKVMHTATHFRRPDGSTVPLHVCPIMHARHDGVAPRVQDDLRSGDTAPQLIARADAELYRVKQAQGG